MAYSTNSFTLSRGSFYTTKIAQVYKTNLCVAHGNVILGLAGTEGQVVLCKSDNFCVHLQKQSADHVDPQKLQLFRGRFVSVSAMNSFTIEKLLLTNKASEIFYTPFHMHSNQENTVTIRLHKDFNQLKTYTIL